MKTFFFFLIIFLNINSLFCQIKVNLSAGSSYVSSQYDIFHHVGVSLRQKQYGFKQEVGLSHKYMVIGKCNWRFQEQICYFVPLSKRFMLENGFSFGFSSQFNKSHFYRLDENLFVAIHFKKFIGIYWKNYLGIMQQLKEMEHLFTGFNFVSQLGITYDL